MATALSAARRVSATSSSRFSTRMAASTCVESVRCCSAGLEPAHGAAALEQLVQHELFGTAGQEAVAKFAEHGKVKAGIRQREPEQIFPVNTSPHCLGGLAIGEIFAELHDA